MNANETNTFMEKIRASLSHIKATLTRNYSWRDIVGMKAWMAHRNRSGSNPGSIASGLSFIPMALATARRYKKPLIALLCIGLFSIASQVWLLQGIKTMQERLELRPVQWAQLQHLIQVNQVRSAVDLSGPSVGASNIALALATPLNESEMQKVRALLTVHDIKPNVLRLSNDNPLRLEFQANDVLFSAWIEVLDALRQGWRLYPDTVHAVMGSSPGLVNISSNLQQGSDQGQFQSPAQAQQGVKAP